MPFSTSLFGALDFLSAVGCLIVAAMAWRRRPAPGVGTFMFLTASIAWWCFWPAAQALNPTALSEYTMIRLAWLGVALAPTAYLLFGQEYLNTGLRLSLAMVLLLALEPTVIIAAVLLNDTLQLLWITQPSGDAAGLAIAARGPLWGVHLVYSYALQAVTSFRFGRFLFDRSGRLHRSQTVLLLIALTVPWAANMLVVAGRSPFATDITAPTLAVSAIAFGVAIFSHRLLDVMPLAQAEVVRSITDGILVLNREQRILDLNPTAAQLAQASAAQAIGRPLAAVMPDLATRLKGEASDEIEIERERAIRVFRVRRSELRDRAGRPCGDIVLLTDVTEERRVGQLERSRELMLEAQESLRQEIAEQLHSSVQTRLLLAELQLTRAMEQLGSDFERGMQLLADLDEKLDHIREQDVRQLSHRLHPSVIAIGLGPALETLVAGQPAGLSIEVRSDQRVRLLDNPIDNHFSPDMRLAMYRIVEEALANVLRHAQATHVCIALTATSPDELLIQVTDDGVGLPEQTGPQGLGLSTITARVAQLGGTWQLTTAPSGGAQLSVRIPLPIAPEVYRMAPPGRDQIAIEQQALA